MLLWDNAGRKRWDVCSTWHVPGPDFLASSNVTDVIVELNDVIEPCDFTISVRSVRKKAKGELEERFLSATECELCVIHSVLN